MHLIQTAANSGNVVKTRLFKEGLSLKTTLRAVETAGFVNDTRLDFWAKFIINFLVVGH